MAASEQFLDDEDSKTPVVRAAILPH